MWVIEKTVKKGEYIYGVCKQHPKATKKGYVLLHRLLIENYLGRQLESNEIVHHINHDKKDNRIENLEVMDKIAHLKYHSSLNPRKTVSLVCPECNKEFVKYKNNVGWSRQNFCSRKCNGTYQRRKQLSNIRYTSSNG